VLFCSHITGFFTSAIAESVAETTYFEVICLAIHLSVVSYIASCDISSVEEVEGFQLNLTHIFILWVGIAEKVFKVRGQSHDQIN